MKFSTLAKFAGQALRGKGEAKMLDVGEIAPDFEVEDHHGNRVRLSAQRGKSVILWFYPKADTPG